MSNVFNNISCTMDPAWGFATGQLNDGNATFGRSVGYAAAATLNTIFAVRGSTFAQQTTAAQRSFKSSSASDSAAGIGAQTILVNYLDNAMTSQQETVTLNGTTAVNMVSTAVQFIESMQVATCGTNLANVGVITMFTGTAGTGSAMSAINIGDNSTFYAHHYVPVGVSCYVIKHTGAATLSAGRTYLVTMGDPRTNSPIQQVGDIIIHLAGGTEDHEYKVPLVIPGPNLIIMRENPVVSTVNNTAYASFDWIQD